MLVDKELFKEPKEDECIVLSVLTFERHNIERYFYLAAPTHKVLPNDIVILPGFDFKKERLTGKVISKNIYKKSETPFPFNRLKYILEVSNDMDCGKKNSYDILKKISEIDNLEELIIEKMGSKYISDTEECFMGYCHLYWSYAQEVLLELGIDWFTPQECNPYNHYD